MSFYHETTHQGEVEQQIPAHSRNMSFYHEKTHQGEVKQTISCAFKARLHIGEVLHTFLFVFMRRDQRFARVSVKCIEVSKGQATFDPRCARFGICLMLQN